MLRVVVLNLFVATEPFKLYQWLTEPLIIGKIKYYLIYQKVQILLVTKMNNAHKIPELEKKTSKT